MEQEQKAVTGLVGSLVSYWELAAAFFLAMFFGFLRYLQDILDPNTPSQFKWVIAVAKGLTAGGVGLLTLWLLSEWQISKNLMAFLIGVAGYGGAETLQAFKEGAFNVLRNMLGKTSEAPQRPPEV